MLISEFARETGLTTDTVRFYIRKGLLTPTTNGKGGRNPYQVFTAEHVRAAKFIRTAQSLGLSLKELAVIGEERCKGRITPARQINILGAQLAKLEGKAQEMDAMRRYLRAKIDWIAAGSQGAPPDFEKCAQPRAKVQSRGLRWSTPA
jgi:MerR family transcriptional regulator, copper efflux regulator